MSSHPCTIITSGIATHNRQDTVFTTNGQLIDAMDIIIRDQIATLDGKLMRGEITTRQHTHALRTIVEAVS